MRRRTRLDPQADLVGVYACGSHFHVGHDTVGPVTREHERYEQPPLTYRLTLPSWVLRLAEDAPSTP